MSARTPHPKPARLAWKWILGTFAVLLLTIGVLIGPRLYAAFSLLHAGEQIDIGGRELFIHCEGSGSPTVLLEHGLGSNGHEWQTVQGDVAEHTRVCWTSRAGMGFSDRPADTSPRTARDAVVDLEAVLDVADIPGPYVLVGHSFGGYVVRLFAARHPDEVVGVVLIDSTHEEQAARLRGQLSDDAWAELSGLFGANNPERMDFVASAHAVENTPDLGQRPLIVLEATAQATNADDAGISQASADEIDAVMADLWPELQADLASLSTAGTHRVVTGSGHFIQKDDPGAVVGAILEILRQIASP